MPVHQSKPITAHDKIPQFRQHSIETSLTNFANKTTQSPHDGASSTEEWDLGGALRMNEVEDVATLVPSKGVANTIEAAMECWANSPPKVKATNTIANAFGMVKPGAGGGAC